MDPPLKGRLAGPHPSSTNSLRVIEMQEVGGPL